MRSFAALCSVSQHIFEEQSVIDMAISCMEHAMHLAAKHFVRGVALTSASSLLQKVKVAMANAMADDDTIDLDTLNSEMGDIEAEMDVEMKSLMLQIPSAKLLPSSLRSNLVFHQYYMCYILMQAFLCRFANLPKHTPSSKNAALRWV